MRKTLLPAAALIGLVLFSAPPAHAVSKEIIQLQTQVQALQDSLQTMQRSNSEQMGVLQHLVEQSSDNINRLTQQMTALQAKVEAESQNSQLSGQIQVFNRIVPMSETLAKLEAVTVEDVRGAAARIFRADPTLAALGPAQRVPGLSAITNRLAA